jgi:hypothetical protein
MHLVRQFDLTSQITFSSSALLWYKYSIHVRASMQRLQQQPLSRAPTTMLEAYPSPAPRLPQSPLVQAAKMHVKRVTLTSKKNWWMGESPQFACIAGF